MFDKRVFVAFVCAALVIPSIGAVKVHCAQSTPAETKVEVSIALKVAGGFSSREPQVYPWPFSATQLLVQYSLDISVDTGGTTDPSPGAYNYDVGANVEVTAIANSGYIFLNWTGDVPSGHETDNPITLTMDSDKSIICHFTLSGQAVWGVAQRITWSTSGSCDPAIAVDSLGNPYVVWDESGPGNEEIYFKKSTDGGATWTMGKRLTSDSAWSKYPDIAIDSSGNLHVVWMDYMSGDYEIYYVKSTDGGSTWMSSKRITWNTGFSGYPAIAIDSLGNPHVVWSDDTPGYYEIFYRKSTDGGTTWKPRKRLTRNSGLSESPDIVADPSGNLHVVWSDNTNTPGNSEIYYKKSTDGGNTWRPSKRVTWTSGASFWPKIGAHPSGNLHLVWVDYTPGNYEIYYRKSADLGGTWTVIKRLTWSAENSLYPGIAVDSSGHPQTVWAESISFVNDEIFFKRSTDGGTSWLAGQRISWSSYGSFKPAIASDSSGSLHLVWMETPSIYYVKGK